MLMQIAAVLLAANTTTVESVKLSAAILKTANPHYESNSLRRAGTNKSSSNKGGVPGIDSIVNFTGQFTAPGFDLNGNPQSVWPYEMVGLSPSAGASTQLNAPVIPVVLDLLASDGSIAFSFDGRKDTAAVLASPVFQPFSNPGGFTQFTDGLMRTQFWNRIHKGDDGDDNRDNDDGYHVLLVPSPKSARHMQIPFFTPSGSHAWFVFVDGSGNPILAAVDEATFGNLLFPTTIPVDKSSVIGAAELAGDMTTKDVTTFLFDNVALFEGSINNCCVLGFHSYDFEPGDKSNGNRERRYVMNFSSFLSPNLFLFGFEDVTTLSHEMSETFDDPFVDNATPWWENVDFFTGAGICQNNLETGDVIEVLSSLPVYSVFTNGRTYHPQNEAMLSWFAFQSPSKARNGAYSYPDETTLTSLSPAGLGVDCLSP